MQPISGSEDLAEGQIVEIGYVDPVACALRSDVTSIKRQVEKQINHQIVGCVWRELIKGRPAGVLPSF
jgi:hypothetical protein